MALFLADLNFTAYKNLIIYTFLHFYTFRHCNYMDFMLERLCIQYMRNLKGVFKIY